MSAPSTDPMVADRTLGAHQRSVLVHGIEAVHAARWGIADEVAVEITLDGAPWTVCMATPADLEELAVGLALTEGRIAQVADVVSVEVTALLGDYRVALRLANGSAANAGARTASPTGACGLCGLESLAALHARVVHRHVPPAGESAVDLIAVRRAFDVLPQAQPLNAATRSVHAAAWCAPDGALQLVREDVGRHNALDKLVGALARAGRLAEDGFVVMTSRCSYELVAKCAHTGARLLATWSAPTTLALHWAATVGLPLCSMMRTPDGVALVTFPEESAHAVG